jgi:hypothetical protein
MNQAVFCEYCGARMEADARFCESCGNAVAEAAAAEGRSPGGQVCPKCRQTDRCSSAAEFVKLDLSESERQEGKQDPETIQQYLAAPERPALPSRVLWAAFPLIPGLNAVMIWFAPIHKYYKFVMLALAAVFVYCVAVPRLYEQTAFAVPGLLLAAVYYAGLIFDRKRQNAELEREQLPRYNRMAANWERLYYCGRCDVSWLADDPFRSVPVEDTEKLLAG